MAESEKIIVGEQSAQPATQIHLVARDPQEMAAAQADLALWIERKLASINCEAVELGEARDIATQNGWDCKALSNQVNKAKQALVYYGKMLEAVRAGFTIVPNFPIDLFAIRVRRLNPRIKEERSHNSSWFPSLRDEQAEALPHGEGRYVSPQQVIDHNEFTETINGRETKVKTTYPTEFAEVEFPLIAARPVVMQATQEAMALQLFDQIGICPPSRPKGDPLIIGQIFLPPVQFRAPKKMASFLIAWHLNLNDL